MSSRVETGAIEGLKMGNNLVNLSHLQFANDTVFCLGQERFFVNLNRFLSFFEAIYGLRFIGGRVSL